MHRDLDCWWGVNVERVCRFEGALVVLRQVSSWGMMCGSVRGGGYVIGGGMG